MDWVQCCKVAVCYHNGPQEAPIPYVLSLLPPQLHYPVSSLALPGHSSDWYRLEEEKCCLSVML